MKEDKKKNSKEVKKDKAIKPINKGNEIMESDSHKQRIEVICNHLLEATEHQKVMSEQGQALARRKVDLKHELVDKLLYKRVNGEKERMNDKEKYFDIVLKCGLTREDINDIVDNVHY